MFSIVKFRMMKCVGVEVAGGESLIVEPGDDKVLHVSQVISDLPCGFSTHFSLTVSHCNFSMLLIMFCAGLSC